MNDSPPRTGWSKLTPEILVNDFQASLAFWRDQLGFAVAYDRPEQPFAYLERPEGAQIMLCARSGKWETGSMDPPFGRGVMFQVNVSELAPIVASLENANWPVHSPVREVWRKTGGIESGRKEIVVQDPDGYLVMLAEPLVR